MNARVEIDPFRKWKHFWAGRSTLNVDTADIPARRRLIRGGLKPSNCNHHMLHILSHLLHQTGPTKKFPDVHIIGGITFGTLITKDFHFGCFWHAVYIIATGDTAV